MITKAFWVRLEAKAGKEHDVAQFLKGGLSLIQQEPATVRWYALQLSPTVFGIFDAFETEAGRQEHLSGAVATALKAKAGELFAVPPRIEQADVLACK
jgi:quinol monooxygenase YgiN